MSLELEQEIVKLNSLSRLFTSISVRTNLNVNVIRKINTTQQ